MDASNIISLLGGVAMFLFGMSVMGDSLRKVTGSRMEMILYRLEPRFLTHPTLALGQSREVIDSMAGKALESVESAVSVRKEYSREALKKVFELEGVLDRYEDKLGVYLYKITSADISTAQSREISKYLRVLSDFERISDHAGNIGEAVQEINEKKIEFSGKARKELSLLEDAITEITRITIDAFKRGDREAALKVDPLEEVIDDLCDEIKSNHAERVSRKECTLENGFVFNDLLTDYERISDHCSNVAVDILEMGDDSMQSHEYHKNLDYREDETFKRYFDEYKQKYSV